MNFKHVLGGLAIALAVVVVAAAIPAIKRYIRISTM